MFNDPLVEDDGREFDYHWMVTLHKHMFGNVGGWAGKLRTGPLSIGIPPHLVEQRLYHLTESIRFFRRPPTTDDLAYLHHQLTVIHPFKNGNGRWSRLVTSLYQYRVTSCHTDWPREVVGNVALTSPIRTEYIAALKAADTDDLKPLAALHDRYTREPDL